MSKHPLASILQYRGLIRTLTVREVLGRYRGSVLGLIWSFLNPLVLLAIYTFVFGIIFKSRWGVGVASDKSTFALMLFIGLIAFSLFNEIVGQAPTLITSRVNYVKKTPFPLEILPVISALSAGFHTLVGILVWVLFCVLIGKIPSVGVVLFPILFLPVFLFSLGLSWFFASLGVYLKDLAQVIGLMTTAFMFMSPVFYPLSAIPRDFVWLYKLNPMTFSIEAARTVALAGGSVDIASFLIATICTALFAWLGFMWFQLTRRGFADVL